MDALSNVRLPLTPVHLAVVGVASVLTTFKAISTVKGHPTVRDLSTGQVGCTLFFSFILFAAAIVKALTWNDPPPKPVAAPPAGQELAAQNGDAPPAPSASELAAQAAAAEAKEQRGYLFAFAEFGLYMLLFWVVDRTDYFPRTGKHYDRDQFWFLWVVLMAVGVSSLQRNHQKTPSVTAAAAKAAALPVTNSAGEVVEEYAKPLQRDQTEEWKGWMQVMFLWYHYFEAKELYNAIRLYIAAYVWMTGFGNFSYYYIRRDFSLKRFSQMMWRLNFFVFFACAVLENSYMLYYICMLHTAYTVFIYATLGIKSEYNSDSLGLTVKFVILSIVVATIWHVPGVFEVVWMPFKFICMYKDSMHEWKFRSTLDHVVWIVGMLTAYNFPRGDAALEWIESRPSATCYMIKAAIVGACLALGYFYCYRVFFLDKYAYNAIHPYTSFIPISIYIVLRNISSKARQYHMSMFAFLGKITLETYIGQFHIWMVTTGPDYTREVDMAPKRLLRLLPEGWPLVNFAFVSVLYMCVCYRIFKVTVHLRSFAVPGDADTAKVMRNLAFMPCFVLAVYALSWGMQSLSA